MRKKVQFAEVGEVVYTLKRRRRTRSISLRVLVGGEVVVGAPHRTSLREIHSFLEQQLGWIHLQKAKQKARDIPEDLKAHSAVHFERHKHRAKALVIKKLKEWNAHYHFSYAKVSVKRMNSRWGSCSTAGNLSFHYKILFLPEELQDYLIVHELCHLQEMNHSRKFWDLVAEAIPDYKVCRSALKRIA